MNILFRRIKKHFTVWRNYIYPFSLYLDTIQILTFLWHRFYLWCIHDIQILKKMHHNEIFETKLAELKLYWEQIYLLKQQQFCLSLRSFCFLNLWVDMTFSKGLFRNKTLILLKILYSVRNFGLWRSIWYTTKWIILKTKIWPF